MEDYVRARLVVSGRVQGVWFRAETQKAALRLGLAGWVRNKRDGTVEAGVEGPRKAVKDLVDWCRTGPPLARVAHVDIAWEEFRGDADTFSIRY